MKKLLKIASVVLLSLITTIVSAQTKTVKSTAKKSATTVKTISAGPTKKDGTPDKRYKANSTTTKTTVGPTKKDGSADMRYKANKTTTSTTKKSTTKH